MAILQFFQKMSRTKSKKIRISFYAQITSSKVREKTSRWQDMFKPKTTTRSTAPQSVKLSPMKPKYVPIAQAAQRMGKSLDEIKELIQNGQLRQFRNNGMMLVKEDDIVRVMAGIPHK
jgi:hypothetical protein